MEIDATFTGTLEKSPNKGGWTYVIWPEAKEVFGTGGSVKVSGTIDGHSFEGTFMPMGGGRQMLPLNAELRKLLGKEAGASITVRITNVRKG